MQDSSPDDMLASVDLLASDFIARYRNGDRPTIEEYARRHPELSEPIRRVFPLVSSVEKVKIDQQTADNGNATLAGRVFERLGDFRLVREIGRGGMGVVYEAEQESLGRTVAIKILPKQSLLDDDALQRFQNEAKTAAAMHHSNIVPIFGTGETDGTHYLVMQFVPGDSLDIHVTGRLANEHVDAKCGTGETGTGETGTGETGTGETGTGETGTSAESVRSEDGKIPICKAASIARQIADGLAYAHECGVLHRDVKPANILLDQEGTALLTDFGLARNVADDPTMTQALSGSPRYMAPERFRGIADERSDVYGLGLTLYEMLAGTPAFTESSSHELMNAVTHHRVEPLDSIRKDIPVDLRTIVSKAISVDPAHRYQTAADLHDDLDRYLSDEPIHARRISTIQRFTRWCRRNPKIAVLSCIAVFSLLAATVASSIGFAMTSAANKRTTAALDQAEQTVDFALQSLDRVVDTVSIPASAMGEMDAGDLNSSSFRLNPSPHVAKVLANIQPLYERLSNQSPSRPDIIFQMTEASIRLAQIQQQLGKTSESAETLHRSIGMLESRGAVAGLSGDSKQQLFSRLYSELGKVHLLELRYEESDRAYQNAIDALDAVAEPNPAARLQLAQAYASLGDPPPQRRRDQSPSPEASRLARERLSQADSILTELINEGSLSSEVAVLRARIKIATTRSAKRPMIRRIGFADAVEILRDQLRKTPEDARIRFALVETLASVNLRRQAGSRQQRSDAAARLQMAMEELRPLRASFPETPLFAVSEVHIWHKQSNLARADEDYARAQELLVRAMEIQSSLVEASPESMPHRCWRALLCRSLAEVYRLQDDLKAAHTVMALANSDLEAIDEESRNHPFAIQTIQIIQSLQPQGNGADEITTE